MIDGERPVPATEYRCEARRHAYEARERESRAWRGLEIYGPTQANCLNAAWLAGYARVHWVHAVMNLLRWAGE